MRQPAPPCRPEKPGNAVRSMARAGLPRRQRGHTLAELLVVVAVLTIMGSVAMPAMETANRDRLDVAAMAVADAFRFARDEAQRTGVLHGVETDVTTNALRVFRLEVKPGGNVPVFDVYHPLTKAKYAVQLGTSPYGSARIGGVGGDASGACDKTNSFAFDEAGIVRCIEPDETRIDNAWVEVTDGSLSSTIKLDAYTGRVLVQ